MIELSKQSGADVVLAGIQIPPNYGQTYGQALAAVYPELSARFEAPLIGFILEDVALNPELMQPDGIHPNAAGAKNRVRQRVARARTTADRVMPPKPWLPVVLAGRPGRDRSRSLSVARRAARSELRSIRGAARVHESRHDTHVP
jgi:hypothetical protein